MKKLSINLFIVVALALSTGSTILPQTTWQKIKNFAARNKGKIIALGVAAIAAGVGIAAAKVVKDKADEAIEKAGIDKEKDSELYYKTFLLVTTVGNLPEKDALELMQIYFSKTQLMKMWHNNALKALAYYWNMNPLELYGKLGLQAMGQVLEEAGEVVAEVAEEISDAVHEGFNKVRNAFGFGPKPKPTVRRR